jgi:hypothetical protein
MLGMPVRADWRSAELLDQQPRTVTNQTTRAAIKTTAPPAAFLGLSLQTP